MEAKLLEYLINDLKNHFGDLLVTIWKKHIFFYEYKYNKRQKYWDRDESAIVGSKRGISKNIDEKITTPAYSHIFVVNEQAQQID